MICPTAKAENFSRRGWTRTIGTRADLPVRQSLGSPEAVGVEAQGAEACNGWTSDELRAEIRSGMAAG
jgi:hypothetical protein